MVLNFHSFQPKSFLHAKKWFRLFKRFETHYEVLKLPQSCTSKEIRDAFITLSKQNHPDKNQNDPTMHTRFIKINEAYNTLIKPSSRRQYDLSLSQKRNLQPPDETYSYDYYAQDFPSTSNWDNSNAEQHNKDSDSYYGFKGLKKVSNNVLVLFLLVFTTVGALIQAFIIKKSFERHTAKMNEETRKNSILLNLAREKAKLYGNEYQIGILKRSLKATVQLESQDSNNEEIHPDPSLEPETLVTES